jgi:hypothetical protein
MSEFLVSDFIPDSFLESKVGRLIPGFIEKEYKDGVGVMMEISTGKVETYFLDGIIHRESVTADDSIQIEEAYVNPESRNF